MLEVFGSEVGPLMFRHVPVDDSIVPIIVFLMIISAIKNLLCYLLDVSHRHWFLERFQIVWQFAIRSLTMVFKLILFDLELIDRLLLFFSELHG